MVHIVNEFKITNGLLLRLLATCKQWWWLWVASTVVFGIIGLSYVLLFKKDVWVASQGLVVRDEANGAVMRLGRFQSQTEMKAAQETIIELAHNPQVLHDALKKVGPEPSMFGRSAVEEWPTAKDIEAFTKKGIEVRAPRGAEFGTTEVIYLDTRHTSRKRVYDLNIAICEGLQERLQQMRRARADGVIAELVTATEMARRELNSTTVKLHAVETEAGPDLSDLRGMTDAVSNGNSSRQQLDNVKAELRQSELQLQQLESDLELAEKAFADPEQILAPNSLLNSQPGLKKLREGLADARLTASQLQGRFTGGHPLVLAAVQAEQEIQVRLHEELGLARQSLVNDAQNRRKYIEKLREQQASLESRLDRLANIRAAYANLVNEVRSRTQILQDAERQLSEAQAARDAAVSCSLLTRIDDPRVGETPEGPGRSTILAGTTVAGLIFGLGIVFLLTPMDGASGFGRRRNDFNSPQGRRAADHMPEARRPESNFVDRRGARSASLGSANAEGGGGMMGEAGKLEASDSSLGSAMPQPEPAAVGAESHTSSTRVPWSSTETADRFPKALLSTERSSVQSVIATQVEANNLFSPVALATQAPVSQIESVRQVVTSSDKIVTQPPIANGGRHAVSASSLPQRQG
jgi:polysaccharide biosynthesis transport protein